MSGNDLKDAQVREIVDAIEEAMALSGQWSDQGAAGEACECGRLAINHVNDGAYQEARRQLRDAIALERDEAPAHVIGFQVASDVLANQLEQLRTITVEGAVATGSANPLDAALRRLREVAATSVPGYNPLETWRHLVADANERGLCVRLAVIQKDYGAGLWERFEARYARPDGQDVPVSAVFAADAKLELYLHDERVPDCFATRDPGTQAAWLDRVFANDRSLMGADRIDHVPFTVPLDWDGAVQVKGCVLESDGSVSWAESVGQPPAFYGVYAGRTPGGFRHVADFDSQSDAERFAAALSAMAERFGNTMPEFWDRRRYDVGLPEDLPRPKWGASWSFTESAKAKAEGWDLAGDHTGALIAAVPQGAENSIVSMPKAGEALDEAAQALVEAKAMEGSELHLKALLYVLSHAIHGQQGSLHPVSAPKPAAREDEDAASEPTEDADIEDLDIGGPTP